MLFLKHLGLRGAGSRGNMDQKPASALPRVSDICSGADMLHCSKGEAAGNKPGPAEGIKSPCARSRLLHPPIAWQLKAAHNPLVDS